MGDEPAWTTSVMLNIPMVVRSTSHGGQPQVGNKYLGFPKMLRDGQGRKLYILYWLSAVPQMTTLTLHEEEEADDAHDGDDDARHNKGQAPGRGNPDTGDERPQDVANRGVRVPDAHDQTSPGENTAGSVALGGLPGSTGTRTGMGHREGKLTFLCQTSFQHMPRQQASLWSAPAHCRPARKRQEHHPEAPSTAMEPCTAWATGLENNHPYPKLLRKHLVCLVSSLLGQSWGRLHRCHG